MKDWFNTSRKALVGAATPGLVILITDVSAEVSKLATGTFAVIATGLLVWLTKNKAPQP